IVGFHGNRRASGRSITCAFEPLEKRELLSGSVKLDQAHGTITLTGTSGKDQFDFWMSDWGQRVLEYQADDVSGGLYSGTEPYFYKTINIYGMGGNDTVDLSECPIGVDINVYSGGTGSDVLNVGPGTPNYGGAVG